MRHDERLRAQLTAAETKQLATLLDKVEASLRSLRAPAPRAPRAAPARRRRARPARRGAATPRAPSATQRGDGADAVQRARQPHLPPVEAGGRRTPEANLRARVRGEAEQERARDPVEDRRVVGHRAEGVVLPPQQARVGALEQAAVRVGDHRLARAVARGGRAERAQPFEVGALAPRRAAGVGPVRDPRDDLGRPGRGGPDREADLAAGTRLDAREPAAGRPGAPPRPPRRGRRRRGPPRRSRGRSAPSDGRGRARGRRRPATTRPRRPRRPPARPRAPTRRPRDGAIRSSGDCRLPRRVARGRCPGPELSNADRLAGGLIEGAMAVHHRRRLRNLGHAARIDPPDDGLWAAGRPAAAGGQRARGPRRRRAGAAARSSARSAARAATCTSPAGRITPHFALDARRAARPPARAARRHGRARRRPRADVGGRAGATVRARPRRRRATRATSSSRGTQVRAALRRALARRCTATTRSS